MKLLVWVKGGPGSGNFGHAGRPGLVGGSQEGSATSTTTVTSSDEERITDSLVAQFGKLDVIKGNIDMWIAPDGTIIPINVSHLEAAWRALSFLKLQPKDRADSELLLIRKYNFIRAIHVPGFTDPANNQLNMDFVWPGASKVALQDVLDATKPNHWFMTVIGSYDNSPLHAFSNETRDGAKKLHTMTGLDAEWFADDKAIKLPKYKQQA